MHLPELALDCGGFRGFRGAQCTGVNLQQRKVAVNESHLATQLVKHLFSCSMPALTGRALIISVSDHGHASVRRSNRMITFGYRSLQSELF